MYWRDGGYMATAITAIKQQNVLKPLNINLYFMIIPS